MTPDAGVTPQLRVVVIEPVGEGGLAHFIDNYCTALVEAGLDVTLFTSSRYEFADENRPFAVDRGMRLWPVHERRAAESGRLVNLLDLSKRRLRRLARAVRLSWELWRAAQRSAELNPDVVQVTRSQLNPAGPVVRRSLQRRGIAVVELVHEARDRERRFGSALAPLLSRIGDRIGGYDGHIALSSGVADTLTSDRLIPADRITTVAHGTSPIAASDPAVIERLSARFDLDGRPLVLCFGAIRPSKGVPILVEAVGLLPPDLDVRVVVAGHPTMNVDPAALAQRAEQLGVADRLEFEFRYLESVEVASLLELASLVVLPYLSASQSGVLHHAAAQAVPALATRVGALQTEIRDGVDGRLVPPDDPAALAATLDEMIRNPERLVEMGEALRSNLLATASWEAAGAAVSAAMINWAARG